MKHLSIAYILSNISVRKHPNRFMYVKVVARQSSDIVRHSVQCKYMHTFSMRALKDSWPIPDFFSPTTVHNTAISRYFTTATTCISTSYLVGCAVDEHGIFISYGER